MSRKPSYEELEQRVLELQTAESELERALQGLRASEELYRILFEQARDVVYFTTPEGRLVDMNDAGLNILGYPREEFKQIDVADHYADPMQREEEKQELQSQGFIKDKEIRLIKRNGSEITCLDSATALKNPDGSVKGYIGTLRDVTTRKRAEKALRESEQKYRSLFENANEAIFVVQDRRLVFLNPKTIELTGYSEEELYSRPFIDFIYQDDKELVMNRHISRLKGEKIPHIYSFRIVRKDGSILWVELNAVLITWYGKTATLNFFSDITERRQAEKALQESEERYRNILESMIDGYYEVDLAGNFTFFNDSVCELLGYSRVELLGMNSRQYTDERNAAALFQAFNEVYRTGISTRGFDWEVIRKDGTRRFVEASVSLMKASDGTPLGFRGIVRDVTNRKHIEEEKEKLRQKLQQAQKMESIGTLAGGIAHNFNNVLMGIQGRASLMMMNKDSSHPDYEHLKGIEEYIRNATELTKDLLGFARGGKYEVKPTDLNGLIEHEIRMFGHTKKEIRIHRKYEENLWPSDVDQGQIRQVLLNLYVNAWQAMPGGGDLYVQTENVILSEEQIRTLKVHAGRYVKITVADTGTGMDEATRQKIFDPFFTTKGIERGSGLGLASVYGIVQNHGGMIQVSSTKGQGTTFEVYLPASDEPDQGESLEINQQRIEYGHGTVLLVDDEEMVLEVGRMMLETLGYRVRIARSGKEAVDLYDKEREEIDLIILDMIMPGMGGGETFDRLKAIEPKVIVLLSSGYSINGQATEIMNRGCRGFIQKPFAMETLSQKVKKALDR